MNGGSALLPNKHIVNHTPDKYQNWNDPTMCTGLTEYLAINDTRKTLVTDQELQGFNINITSLQEMHFPEENYTLFWQGKIIKKSENMGWVLQSRTLLNMIFHQVDGENSYPTPLSMQWCC